MTSTLDYNAVAPKAVRPLFEAGKALAASGLDRKLLILSQIRASQINGCAFCLALHTKEAAAVGEPLERITGLSAWHESPWYSPRERIALEWTESLTKLSQAHPDEQLLQRAREQFTDEELVYLSLASATITAWNQLNVAFGTSPELADAVFRQIHPNGVSA